MQISFFSTFLGVRGWEENGYYTDGQLFVFSNQNQYEVIAIDIIQSFPDKDSHLWNLLFMEAFYLSQ